MNQKKQHKTRFLNGNYALLPILFVLCIVPLIMRLYKFYPGLSLYPWRSNTSQETDVFLYYKAVALIVSAVFMVIILVFSILASRKERSLSENITKLKQAKWIIAVGIFGLFALLSTLFSEYRSYGFSGFLEQFESIWVVLAYCTVAIYTFYFVRTKKDVDVLCKGLFFLLAVLCAIGFSQLAGHDILATDLGKSIYVPSRYEQLKDSLNFNSSNSIYMTLLNPNYVGMFSALVLPICIMLCIGSNSFKKKAAWGIMSVAVFLCALGSDSKAFLLTIIAVVAIGALLLVIRNIKFLPVITAVISVFVILISAYNTYSDNNLYAYVKKALTPVKNSYVVEDFIIESDKVTLKYSNKQISFQVGYNSFSQVVYLVSTDEDGANIMHTMDNEGIIHFDDERYNDITVGIYIGANNLPYVIEINAAGHDYRFSYENGSYCYVNNLFKIDPIVTAPSAIFTNYDRLFSGRGYIWSRSIPLLKNSLILGTGADSFCFVYPHNDYIARTNAGYQNRLTTRPHNIYLQTGIQYGVPALICYLFFILMYIVQTFRLCWKADYKNSYYCLALGIFLGIIGYFVMGLTNDSCVAVAPVAWLILGLGYALNYMLKKEKAQAQ